MAVAHCRRRGRNATTDGGRSSTTPAVSVEPILDVKVCGCISAQNYMGEADDFFLNVEPRRLSYFTFDWRRDCWETTERLEAHLRKVKRSTASRRRSSCTAWAAISCSPRSIAARSSSTARSYAAHLRRLHRLLPPCAARHARRAQHEARRPTDGRHMGMRLPGSVPARRPAARRRRRQAAHGISRREGVGGAAGARPIPVDWYDVADWERLKLGPWMGGATVSPR